MVASIPALVLAGLLVGDRHRSASGARLAPAGWWAGGGRADRACRAAGGTASRRRGHRAWDRPRPGGAAFSAWRRARRADGDAPTSGAPDQVRLVMGAAGSFAAISTIFGNPIIGAVIIIEAAGLGGPTLPLVLLPGRGGWYRVARLPRVWGRLSGLSPAAYALAPLNLPPTPAADGHRLRLGDRPGGVVRRSSCVGVLEVAWSVERVVIGRAVLLVPVVGFVIAVVAAIFVQLTGQPFNFVLTSGQDAMRQLRGASGPVAAGHHDRRGAVLQGRRVGPFDGRPSAVARHSPRCSSGMAAGILIANLTGFPETPAIAIGMAAATVSALRLPLSSVILATVVAQAGLTVAPLDHRCGRRRLHRHRGAWC